MPQATPISPLRQRLIGDMTFRNFSPKTHRAFVHSAKILAEFLRRSPIKTTIYDLQLFRLHLSDRTYSVRVKNQSPTASRLLYRFTIPRYSLVSPTPIK